MKVGDTYEYVTLLDPKRFPKSKGPIPFKIIKINVDGSVDIEDVNGKIVKLDIVFIKHFCKQKG